MSKNNSVSDRGGSPLRLWVGRVALVLVSPVLVLLLLEGVFRIFTSQPPSSFFVERTDGETVWVNDNYLFGHTIFRPRQSRLPGPGLFPKDKPADTLRLLVLGESAALGFPDPEFGLGRVLQHELSLRYPGQAFDVINGTMTEINSHILLEVAREAMRYDPDLIVLYMGNNEAIGPHSPVGVFGTFYPARWMIQTDRWLRKYSALVRGLVRLRNQREPLDVSEWRGLDHFKNTPIRAESARMQRMRDYTRANVRDLVNLAVRHQVPMLVVPAAVNLRDWPPLFSFVEPAAQPRIDAQLMDATEMIARLDWHEARRLYEGILAEAPDHAEAHYGLARCLEALGEEEQAYAAYEDAAFYDGYRFRTDRVTVDVLREIVEQHADGVLNQQLAYVDVRSALYALQQAGRVPFLEHVHLSLDGMVAVSRLVADRVPTVLPELQGRKRSEVDERTVKDALFALPDVEVSAWSAVEPFLEMQVFRGQSGYQQRLTSVRQQKQVGLELQRQLDVPIVYRRFDEAPLIVGEHEHWQRMGLLGRYLLNRAAFTEAVEILGRYLSYRPDAPTYRHLLGYGLYQAGQLDEAMDALNRALAVNPYDAETWNLLGLARFRSGRVAEARDAYARALAINGRHAAALNNAGYLDYQAGDYDKAEALFRRALSADPELVEARYHLGLSLLAREQFSQAALQFREVVTQQPTMARAWNALGMAAYAEGNRKAAENHFLRALRIDPSLEQSIVNLGRLRLVGDQAASAAELLGAHVQSYPQHAQACHVYALALAQSEQWADALAEWDQLFARVNNQPFWLLEAAALIGEHASATEKDLAAARGYLRQAAAILGEQHEAVQAGWQRLRDAR